MTNLIIVPDETVHLIWLEPSSGKEISITPDWLQQNGTPYDGMIEKEMTYLRTEIEQNPKIKPNEFFKTPDSFGEITTWISDHPKEDRPHLLLAAMMSWNLACKVVNEND